MTRLKHPIDSVSEQSPRPTGSGKGMMSCIRDIQSVLDGLDSECLDDGALQMLVDSTDLQEEEQSLVQELSLILRRPEAADTNLPRVSRDAHYEIKVTEDGWMITLDISLAIGQGKPVTTSMIVTDLKAMGAGKGVDFAAIKKAVDQQINGVAVRDARIARGRMPKPAQAGYVELYCRATPDSEQEAFRGLTSVPDHGAQRICKVGDKIACYYPPVLGEPGYNALGQAVEPEPVDTESFEPGENVRIEGQYLVSEAEGTIEIAGNTIGVRRILLINQDVVGEDKQIQFDGDVSLDASARGGCSIVATGDVVVKGTVGAAHIESKNGSVHLHQGVAGQDKAKIVAALDIHARFAENAELWAGRNIELEIGSMHANMSAGQEFISEHSRGQVLGGILIAGQCVRANQLGNQSGVKTVVMCGYSPKQLRYRSEITLKRATCKSRLDQLTTAAEGVRRMAGDIARMPQESQAVFAKLLQAILLTRKQLTDLEAQAKVFDEDPDRPENAQIRASTTVNAGVECWIGPAKLLVSEPRKHCRIAMQNGQAKLMPM